MTYGSAFDALGSPTRLALLGRLRRGPRSVGDLARTVSVSRPAVSQHLRVLKDAGLVSETSVGTVHLHAINPAGIAKLSRYLERLTAAGRPAASR